MYEWLEMSSFVTNLGCCWNLVGRDQGCCWSFWKGQVSVPKRITQIKYVSFLMLLICTFFFYFLINLGTAEWPTVPVHSNLNGSWNLEHSALTLGKFQANKLQAYQFYWCIQRTSYWLHSFFFICPNLSFLVSLYLFNFCFHFTSSLIYFYFLAS